MAFNILSMLMAIVVKRLLIDACGNDVNGLNALYQSVIGVLSVAELGVGRAISFCMYKPIVDGDNDKVSALYHLFRKLHLIIGGFIFIVGLGTTPFLKFLAKDYASLDVNFYTTFGLVLISTVITYLFGAKIGLINAYKNNYITSIITYGGMLAQYIFQIVVLAVTKSFEAYLACRILGSLLQWGVTNLVTKRKYFKITSNYQKVDAETKVGLIRSIKAMFMHKFGKMLVSTIDSIVISSFVGVIALGEYSNYIVILSAMTGVIKLIFTSITSIIGHLYAESDYETSKRNFEMLHFANFAVGVVFFLGYYAVIDNLVAMVFAKELVISRSITFVITFNGFIQFMRESIIAFRDATGAFYHDRWMPVVEGCANMVLSILLVNRLGVVGVILATVVTNLVISHIVEPLILYKNAFNASPAKHYIRNYIMVAVFGVVLVCMNHFMYSAESQAKELVINGCISVGFSMIVCLVAATLNGSVRKKIASIFKNKRA